MKYTLLDLTQSILSSMDSDEINSINDTPESQQVVAIIKTVYNDIISRGGLSSIKAPFTLNSSGDNTKPVLMSKPDNIVNIEWLKYNKMLSTDTDPNWSDVTFLPLEAFIQFSHNLTPSEPNISSFTQSANGFDFTFNFATNVAPQFYSSFDDNFIIFDAYDSTVDTTLQSSKTLAFGLRNLVFVESDGFVPELQADQFSLLLNEAKSLAWAELKQVPHQKAEMSARKNWSHLGKSKQAIPVGRLNNLAGSFNRLPNFGRK